MPSLTGFESSLLDRIHLKELVEFLLITPMPTVIVEPDPAGFELTNGWVAPSRKPNPETGYLFAKKTKGSASTGWQAESLASSTNGLRVPDFRLNVSGV